MYMDIENYIQVYMHDNMHRKYMYMFHENNLKFTSKSHLNQINIKKGTLINMKKLNLQNNLLIFELGSSLEHCILQYSTKFIAISYHHRSYKQSSMNKVPVYMLSTCCVNKYFE